MINVFEKYNKQNSLTKINLIERQLTLLNLFVKDYPQIRNLQPDEIEKLLSSIIKKSQTNTDPTEILMNSKPNGPIMLSRDCAQQWARDVYRCEVAYGLALIAIWGGVIAETAFTDGAGAAPAIALGLVNSAVAYLASEFCIDWATEDFFDCI